MSVSAQLNLLYKMMSSVITLQIKVVVSVEICSKNAFFKVSNNKEIFSNQATNGIICKLAKAQTFYIG